MPQRRGPTENAMSNRPNHRRGETARRTESYRYAGEKEFIAANANRKNTPYDDFVEYMNRAPADEILFDLDGDDLCIVVKDNMIVQ